MQGKSGFSSGAVGGGANQTGGEATNIFD